jgi:hypothetical protein
MTIGTTTINNKKYTFEIKKVCAGFYNLKCNGNIEYAINKTENGDWLLYEGFSGSASMIDNYRTAKKAKLNALKCAIQDIKDGLI